MTLTAILKCDGHRHGQPCRAYRPGGLIHAGRDGWRVLDDRARPRTVLCPSRGHDEER